MNDLEAAHFLNFLCTHMHNAISSLRRVIYLKIFVEWKERSYRLCLKSSIFGALSNTKRRARAARCHDPVMTITGRLWLTSISGDARSSSNSNLFDEITISENKSSKSDKLNIDMANSQAQKIDAIKNIPLTEKIMITSVLSFTSRDCINYRKAVCEKASHCMSMYLFSPPAFENKFFLQQIVLKIVKLFYSALQTNKKLFMQIHTQT